VIADQNLDYIYFQQDGASPHYGVNVCQYLDEIFSDRWIRQKNHIEWLVRSSDLNLLDYFFWRYLKSKGYITEPQDLNDLRQRIVHEINLIQQIYRNAVSGFYNRLAHCQARATI